MRWRGLFNRFHANFRIARNLALVLSLHRRKYLIIARAVAVVADGLATKLATQPVKVINRFNRIVDRAIAGLGNAVVDIPLRCRQNVNVLLGADVHRGDELRR